MKKAGLFRGLPFFVMIVGVVTYFLNALLTPTTPTNPKPRRSKVAGSGTEVVPP